MQSFGLNKMAHKMTEEEKSRTSLLLNRMKQASERKLEQTSATGLTENDLDHLPPEFHDYFEINHVA